MKKIIIFSISLTLVFSLVLPAFAQQIMQQGKNSNFGLGNGSGTQAGVLQMNADSSGQAQQNQNQQQVQVQAQAQNQGEGTQLQVQIREKAQNLSQLQEMIKEKKGELQAELSSLSNKVKQKVFQNQNQVRETVFTLLASQDLVGGIGSQISEITQQFNNSLGKTVDAEEKIQTRSKIREFFFGGDDESANEIEGEVVQNRNRIQELKQLWQDCDCADDVKEILQSQIQNMEQEQDRLAELAVEQKNKKGFFGWLFSWLD